MEWYNLLGKIAEQDFIPDELIIHSEFKNQGNNENKIIAIIPARSGSKGLRNKNALMLIDKPLLAYTIEAALQSEMFEKVIVTTDSEQYGAIAESYGADFLLRLKN